MDAFAEKKLGQLSLKNCFIRSATNENMGTVEGEVTDTLSNVYEELAENEIGLIITAHFAVNEMGRANLHQPIISRENNYAKFKRLTSAVHAKGSKIIMQLNHGGYKAPVDVNSCTPQGPSATDVAKALTVAEIHGLIKDYIRGAIIAKRTGFDGVQVHGAHGYLLSEFIDPAQNKRTDDYGGSVEKRFRFARAIIEGIRLACGSDFLIAIKVNANSSELTYDYKKDLVEVGCLCEHCGVDLIELSGTNFSQLPPQKELYFLEEAKLLKSQLQIPVALVGGIHDKETIEIVLAAGIDFVSLSRPLICEPDFVRKLKEQTTVAAQCIRCNQCYKLYLEKGKRCIRH